MTLWSLKLTPFKEALMHDWMTIRSSSSGSKAIWRMSHEALAFQWRATLLHGSKLKRLMKSECFFACYDIDATVKPEAEAFAAEHGIKFITNPRMKKFNKTHFYVWLKFMAYLYLFTECA